MTVVETQTVLRQHLHTIGEGQCARVGFHAGSVTVQQTGRYDGVPVIIHANEQKALKSEDVIYVRRVESCRGNAHSIFMVCDGHQGAGAANHCVEHMPGLLGQLLPQHLPDWNDPSVVSEYAEKVRRAISTAAVLLDNDWARTNDMSGTTMTLAVMSGWLLTVANTGDSNAVIDCGDSVHEITCSHRIQVNKSEQNRLRQNGAQLAPLGFHLQGPAKPQEMGVGPLRMWPGGLCVSRSIGDLDAGPLIVPLPHVRQVLLNRHRALRLIMASDGLWDLMTFSKAAKSVRHKLPHQAVTTLAQMVARDRRMADDVSIVIIDILPPAAEGVMPQHFPASALQATSKLSSNGMIRVRSSSGGGFFGCFKSPAVIEYNTAVTTVPVAQQQQLPGSRCSSVDAAATAGSSPLSKPWKGLEWLADVDCYEAYPLHNQQLARASVSAGQLAAKRAADYTVHGGQAHKFQQDHSWHTGNSEHGASNIPHLPTFLSQQQLAELQAIGPAAAANMTLHSLAAAAAASLYGNSANHDRGEHEQIHGGSLWGARGVAEDDSSSGSNGSSSRLQPGGQIAQDPASTLLMMGSGVLNNAMLAAAAAQKQQQQGQCVAVNGGSSSRPEADPCRGDETTNSTHSSDRHAAVLKSLPSHRRPTEHYNLLPRIGGSNEPGSSGHPMQRAGSSMQSFTAAQGGQHHVTSGMSPASPAPGALLRSASAEFETDAAALYVAGDDARPTEGRRLAAPGRVIGPHQGLNNRNDHLVQFGSAPAAAERGQRGASRQGPVFAAAAAAAATLTAAAVAADAEEEEAGLRALGVKSALYDDPDTDIDSVQSSRASGGPFARQ